MNRPGTRGPIPRPTHERFWKYVDKRGPSECWPWTGSKSSGYGMLTLGSSADATRRRRVATRIALEIHGVQVLDSDYVLHRCDNPACVNPAHLYTGSQRDNMRDCIERGRFQLGRKHYASILTREQVQAARFVRALTGASYGVLGRALGVVPGAIRRAVLGETWAGR